MKYMLPVRVFPLVAVTMLSACSDSSDDNDSNGGDGGNGGLINTPVDNVAPALTAFTATPANLTTGQQVEFTWDTSDGDSDNLTCTIDTDGDGNAEYSINNCQTTTSQFHIYDSPGDYSATMRVTDPAGGSASRVTNISVTGTQSTAPVISSFTATPPSSVPGTATEFAWSISDPASQGVSCTIDIDNDGTAEYEIADCVSELSVSHIYETEGDFTALLVATNLLGESRERSIAVSVTAAGSVVDPNSPQPIITSYLVETSSVMIEEEVNFSWSYTDPDGSTATCSIDFDGDGFADQQFSPCAADSAVNHVYDLPGAYDAVLTIENGEGGVATGVRTINVVPVSLKLAADGPAVPGDSLRYTYTVSNVASTPVDNVRVLFRVPTGLSFNGSSDASPNASCFNCGEDDEASWTFASMQAGESRTIEVFATVSDNIAPGSTIRAVVSVTADTISGSVNRRIDIPVDTQPVASLKLSASADALLAGDTLTMVAHVGNISNDNLSDMTLAMTLPKGSSVANISNGGMQGADGAINWPIASLPVLETLERQVSFTISTAAIPAQIKMTSASLSHANAEVIDSTAMLPVSISEDLSQLKMEVTTSTDPVIAGRRVRYQIAVSNPALVPASDVSVLLRTPPGISFNGSSDASPNSSCFNCPGGTESAWSFENIPAGETRVMEVNATASVDLQAGSLVQASIIATASTLSDTINIFDVLAIDNRESSTVSLSTPLDSYLAGENVTITADVGNTSTAFLEGVSLDVSLPPGSTFISASGSGVHDATENKVTWPIGTLPVLETTQRTVSFALSSASLAGELAPLAAQVQHDGGAEIDAGTSYNLNIAATTSPLEVTISTDENVATPGDRVRYTVTLKNNAFVPLNDVSIVHRVPRGLSFNGSSDVEPNASCFNCPSETEASWTFASIPAGETRVLDVNALLSSDIQAGNLLVAPFVVRATNLANDISVNHITSVVQMQ